MINYKRIFKLLICILLVFTINFGFLSQVTNQSVALSSKQISQKADKILKKMTLKQKIAQMLYVYVPAKSAEAEQKKYQYGGYLMFADSFKNKSKTSVKNTIKNLFPYLILI